MVRYLWTRSQVVCIPAWERGCSVWECEQGTEFGNNFRIPKVPVQCAWRPLVAVAYSYEVASKEIASLGNGVKMAIPTEVEDRLLVLERLFEVRLKFVGSKST